MRRDRQTAWAATHESGTSWVQLPGRKRLLRFTERDVAELEALLPLMRRPAMVDEQLAADAVAEIRAAVEITRRETSEVSARAQFCPLLGPCPRRPAGPGPASEPGPGSASATGLCDCRPDAGSQGSC